MSNADKYRNDFFALLGLIAIVLFLVAIATFKDFEITVDPYDNSVIAISSRWWGLSKTEKQIRWMQPKGYDSSAWCAKDENGEWYPYILEPVIGPDYEY